ncbi:urease subunit beta [Microbacterium candidum]|uniref:Urease subunit beta n=1 Tax=Microbacterium candidum TaxID=3041922 RepID=A0ABT7MTF1_9MICO|nr:urease subunit beta [Microbacterium sp. ASV49]MDL9977726.1 urease subunit beta [Microbacterium sp. ASV49]
MVSRKPKYHHNDDSIEINAGRDSVTIRVTNTGDRLVQIGSHFHFFEVNRALRFEREQAWGMHLDIPAGTGVRFEPGGTKEVTLVAYAGGRSIHGFNGLVEGGLDAQQTKVDAMRRLDERGFENGDPDFVPGSKNGSN